MGLVSSQVLILAPPVVDVGLLYGPEGVVAYLGYIMDEPCPQIQHWALGRDSLIRGMVTGSMLDGRVNVWGEVSKKVCSDHL